MLGNFSKCSKLESFWKSTSKCQEQSRRKLLLTSGQHGEEGNQRVCAHLPAEPGPRREKGPKKGTTGKRNRGEPGRTGWLFLSRCVGMEQLPGEAKHEGEVAQCGCSSLNIADFLAKQRGEARGGSRAGFAFPTGLPLQRNPTAMGNVHSVGFRWLPGQEDTTFFCDQCLAPPPLPASLCGSKQAWQICGGAA